MSLCFCAGIGDCSPSDAINPASRNAAQLGGCCNGPVPNVKAQYIQDSPLIGRLCTHTVLPCSITVILYPHMHWDTSGQHVGTMHPIVKLREVEH